MSPTDLVQRLSSMDWLQFEELVGHVYQKLGYAVTRRGGASPDGAVDLVIENSGQCAAVQCRPGKTWSVRVKEVREFVGGLLEAGIQKGILISLCGCTGPAQQLAQKHGIEIVTEAGLAQMLEAINGRSDPRVLELLRDTRKFCPKCECELVIRVAGRGAGTGASFWGCSGYPHCQFTMPIE